MTGLETVLLGFVGCGGMASIAWFLSSRVGNKSNENSTLHNIVQKFIKNDINEIEINRKIVKAKIKEGENVSKETEKRIKDIQKEEQEKIKEVLKQDAAVENLVDDFNTNIKEW